MAVSDPDKKGKVFYGWWIVLVIYYSFNIWKRCFLLWLQYVCETRRPRNGLEHDGSFRRFLFLSP